jgi:hypothetical protein
MHSAQLLAEHSAYCPAMQAAYAGPVERRESLRRKRRRERLIWLFQHVAKAAEVAIAVNTPSTYLSAIAAGDRGLGDALAEKIENEYELGSGWFDRDEQKPAPAPSQGPDGDYRIHEYAAAGAMGHGLVLEAQPPGVIRSWTVNPEWLRLNVPHHTGIRNLRIVTGFGPSMRGMFNPGDPLLCDCGVNRVEVDGVYFFRVDDHGFIKILQRVPTEKGVVLRAKSKNPDYEPFDITPKMAASEGFEVFGKILTVWRSEQL